MPRIGTIIEQIQRGEPLVTAFPQVALESGKADKLITSTEVRVGTELELTGATDEKDGQKSDWRTTRICHRAQMVMLMMVVVIMLLMVLATTSIMTDDG